MLFSRAMATVATERKNGMAETEQRNGNRMVETRHYPQHRHRPKFFIPKATLGCASATYVNHNVNIPRGLKQKFLQAVCNLWEKKNIISKSAGSICCNTKRTKAAVILKALTWSAKIAPQWHKRFLCTITSMHHACNSLHFLGNSVHRAEVDQMLWSTFLWNQPQQRQQHTSDWTVKSWTEHLVTDADR